MLYKSTNFLSYSSTTLPASSVPTQDHLLSSKATSCRTSESDPWESFALRTNAAQTQKAFLFSAFEISGHPYTSQPLSSSHVLFLRYRNTPRLQPPRSFSTPGEPFRTEFISGRPPQPKLLPATQGKACRRRTAQNLTTAFFPVLMLQERARRGSSTCTASTPNRGL